MCIQSSVDREEITSSTCTASVAPVAGVLASSLIYSDAFILLHPQQKGLRDSPRRRHGGVRDALFLKSTFPGFKETLTKLTNLVRRHSHCLVIVPGSPFDPNWPSVGEDSRWILKTFNKDALLKMSSVQLWIIPTDGFQIEVKTEPEWILKAMGVRVETALRQESAAPIRSGRSRYADKILPGDLKPRKHFCCADENCYWHGGGCGAYEGAVSMCGVKAPIQVFCSRVNAA
ncbi:hypothetical protein EVAR_67650_1 [Eumeta japonica]|uniref:Uncharacterized protein n=1 Tax=Eumeta variegata TaxID=151549 RepID=A0A4C1Z5F0_EUMVA|nr:hypothetical protein EVAR_67650_1 [Eumeta japonica]